MIMRDLNSFTYCTCLLILLHSPLLCLELPDKHFDTDLLYSGDQSLSSIESTSLILPPKNVSIYHPKNRCCVIGITPGNSLLRYIPQNISADVEFINNYSTHGRHCSAGLEFRSWFDQQSFGKFVYLHYRLIPLDL